MFTAVELLTPIRLQDDNFREIETGTEAGLLKTPGKLTILQAAGFLPYGMNRRFPRWTFGWEDALVSISRFCHSDASMAKGTFWNMGR